jgi:hypothetical protein
MHEGPPARTVSRSPKKQVTPPARTAVLNAPSTMSPPPPSAPPASERKGPTVAAKLALAAGFLIEAARQATMRRVSINGVQLDDQGLAFADGLNCGQKLADGDYWLDPQARTWGVVGTHQGGPIPNCTGQDPAPAATQPAPQPSSGGECDHHHYHEDKMFCLQQSIQRRR